MPRTEANRAGGLPATGPDPLRWMLFCDEVLSLGFGGRRLGCTHGTQARSALLWMQRERRQAGRYSVREPQARRSGDTITSRSCVLHRGGGSCAKTRRVMAGPEPSYSTRACLGREGATHQSNVRAG